MKADRRVGDLQLAVAGQVMSEMQYLFACVGLLLVVASGPVQGYFLHVFKGSFFHRFYEGVWGRLKIILVGALFLGGVFIF